MPQLAALVTAPAEHATPLVHHQAVVGPRRGAGDTVLGQARHLLQPRLRALSAKLAWEIEISYYHHHHCVIVLPKSLLPQVNTSPLSVTMMVCLPPGATRLILTTFITMSFLLGLKCHNCLYLLLVVKGTRVGSLTWASSSPPRPSSPLMADPQLSILSFDSCHQVFFTKISIEVSLLLTRLLSVQFRLLLRASYHRDQRSC